MGQICPILHSILEAFIFQILDCNFSGHILLLIFKKFLSETFVLKLAFNNLMRYPYMACLQFLQEARTLLLLMVPLFLCHRLVTISGPIVASSSLCCYRKFTLFLLLQGWGFKHVAVFHILVLISEITTF